MYNNNTQYPNTGYQDTYSQYPQNYQGSYANYQEYGTYPHQSHTTEQPVSSGQQNYSSANNWGSNYRSNPKDAVAQEMQQQKAQLIRQREDYVKKASVLKHELEQLKLQKQDLIGNGRSPDTDLVNILKQNDKLQEEIQGKMKAIHNVIEMLSSIIKDNKSLNDLETELVTTEKAKIHTPPTKTHQDVAHKSRSPEVPKKTSAENYCYVHYDTGLHWCRMCDEFPETAKDLLLHLQEKKHRETAKENDVDSTPWHKLPTEPLMPSDEKAPIKRVPIKGLQFFISAPSWYCKLCDIWIGDLHCASQHLKSQSHYQNYENFVAQNPQWEMEWLKDRERAKTRKGVQDSSESDDEKKKRKRKEKRISSDTFSLKEKKKKKKSRRRRKLSSDSSSSSSSSDSSSDDDNEDRSQSIRVAMRNMKKVQSIIDEDLTAKWSVLEKLVEEHKKKEKEKLDKDNRGDTSGTDDPLINQWMTVSQPPEKDKLLLDSLKDRMRQKQEQERTRLAEMEKHRRDREREESERSERRKREEREAAEEEDRKRKLREQEELERIRDKDRNQVRFKTNNYRRKRRSYSRSDDEDNNHQNRYYKRDSYRKDSEGGSSYRSHNSRSRSRSVERRREDEGKKKPPGPPSYKKLPFIGRMPLFKNRVKNTQEDKDEPKELKKQSYETPRRTRFEPGNLPKAFIPRPDVVCFPKLSSIPPLTIPPPAPVVTERVQVPMPPKISDHSLPLKAPPPPKLDKIEPKEDNNIHLSDDEVLYSSEGVDPNMMGQYYQNYGNNMYQDNPYDYQQQEEINPLPPPPPPHSHSMPLQPPPLPPDDDLALLGICADDMAAQTF